MRPTAGLGHAHTAYPVGVPYVASDLVGASGADTALDDAIAGLHATHAIKRACLKPTRIIPDVMKPEPCTRVHELPHST